MTDKILNLIKNNVMNVISDKVSVPEDKKQQTVDVTAEALASGFKNHLNLSDVSGMMNLFGGAANTGSNPMINGVESTVVNALVQKVGLSQTVATTIASTVIPMVINAFKNKVNDPGEKDFTAESVLKSITGGNNNGGILGSLGKLFS